MDTQTEQNLVISAEVVPFSAIVISSEKESVAAKLAELEQRGILLALELEEIKIADQETYDAKSAKLAENKSFVKEAEAFCEPFRALTYGLYQKVMDVKKRIVADSTFQIFPAVNEILAFERKKAEEERIRQQELEAQQRKEEEERKLAAAASAEQVGMGEQAVQAILNEPSVQPKPVAPPAFTPSSTHVTRDAWQAEEDTANGGLWALVKAAAKDKKLLAYLEPNTMALNGTARALKTAMAVPGFKAVNKGSIAAKAR